MSTTNVYPTSARGPVEHDVRQQIVTAAKEHFSRYGYEKTTVSDLAKAIGFSKAYIYKFFESKQVIGEMICSNCLMEMERSEEHTSESSHLVISYAVFCLKKKTTIITLQVRIAY